MQPARLRVGKAAQRPGLVSSQTSDTPQGAILLDPRTARLQRMRSRLLTGARLHVQQRARWRAAMLTATYRPGVEWSRRHISECLKNMRQWLKRRGIECRYVWVMELTKAGKEHYHIVIWLPMGRKLPKLDDAGWWPHGSTRMEWARCAVGYVSKYVSKGGDGINLAKGARMYGVGGLTDDALLEARWWALPQWMRKRVPLGGKATRSKGGGWLDHDTGEIHRSGWMVFFNGGCIYLIPPQPEC